MQELNLSEVQEIELRLLDSFDEICRKKGFRYSLGGGSLLGAIRHKGFIPWDDDIDVMMPRPDYEQFLAYCRSYELGFKLFEGSRNDSYYSLFAKLSDMNTLIIDKIMNTEVDIGVNIDVFPIDGLGNSYSEALKTFRSTTIEREILNASQWDHFERSRTHGILLEPVRLVMYGIGKICNRKTLYERIESKLLSVPFDTSSYAGCVCGSYREKEIMRQEVFTSYETVTFEKKEYSIISAFHEYLTAHYGNYMELPPENKRVTHHTYRAYKR